VLRQFLRSQRKKSPSDVFVVHGHDAVKHSVSHFISLLGLRPVMLDDRPNRGRTIIEKLEDHSNASFAVILLTPDDVGAKRDMATYAPRARQNVILELGYFLAKLGRERVCALYVPGVELPSDVHGLLYVELDTAGGWKYQLQKELADAGLPIQLETHSTIVA
jgi:predicted nucleotide-binding protein